MIHSNFFVLTFSVMFGLTLGFQYESQKCCKKMFLKNEVIIFALLTFFRLEQEYTALIKYVQLNKEHDNDWFVLESNNDGTRWFGKCWHIHNFHKYEFTLQFDVRSSL